MIAYLLHWFTGRRRTVKLEQMQRRLMECTPKEYLSRGKRSVTTC